MDSYNLFINVNTPFKKNARAVKSKKLQPEFKKFVRANAGFFDGVDLLRSIGKAYNPVSDRIVNRSTIYTKGKNARVRAKFQQPVFAAQVAKYDAKLEQLYAQEGAESVFNLQAMTNKAIEALIEKINTSVPLAAIIEKADGTKTHYALNDKTIGRLFAILAGDVETIQTGSDDEIIEFIRGGKTLTLRHLATSSKNSGAFFKYTLREPLDGLDIYGIYNDVNVDNYEDSCFIKALEASGVVGADQLDKIRLTIKTRHLPMCNMRKIAERFGLHIKVRGISNTRRVHEFGDKSKPLVDLGLIDQHYFLISKTNYTSYSLKNYEAHKHKERWNEYVKKGARDATRFINSLELFKLLTNDEDVKKTFLQPIKICAELFATPHFEKVKDFPALEVNAEDFEPVIFDDEKIDKKQHRLKNANRVWFDFETNVYTGGRHVPYLCYYVDESGESFGFRGVDCGRQMLNHLHNRFAYLDSETGTSPHSLFMIAHNASYDFTTGLIEHLYGVKTIEKGSMLMSASGTYYHHGKPIDITLHDSYAKIPKKLASFGKMFNLEQEKDVMPYPVYNTPNIAKGWATVKECKKVLKPKERAAFVANCKKWGCLSGDRVDIIEYSARYCEIDCIVLRAGYLKFAEMMENVCGLNIDHYVSIASMADEYLIKEGCYDGCYSLGGVPRAFIQRCLVGGRTMLSENTQQKQTGVQMADFDAVSLYPSAMNRLAGFLKGAPECIASTDYNELCKIADGFYVRVKITGVGVKRSFPLLSYVNDDGIRIFTNDIVGRVVYIDDVALADAVKFQGITFEIIDGYQFTDGFNDTIISKIEHLFLARLKAKKQKNPVQEVIKLICNSCYGKTALKEIAEENEYVGKKDFDKYIVRHYNWIKDAVESHDGKRYRITKMKAINEHFNRVHIGIQILSMSKRIMNEVMNIAEDEGHTIYYQDTDSMHIMNQHVPLLADSFRAKYGRELIGKGMGQFHVDFDLSTGRKDEDGEDIMCEDIYSENFIGLGKKSYIDCLVGTDKDTGEKKRGYHIRMKGVPNGAILGECKRQKCTPYELYEKLHKGEAITFNLLKDEHGDRVRFEKTKTSTMITKKRFERVIQFNKPKKQKKTKK